MHLIQSRIRQTQYEWLLQHTKRVGIKLSLIWILMNLFFFAFRQNQPMPKLAYFIMLLFLFILGLVQVFQKRLSAIHAAHYLDQKYHTAERIASAYLVLQTHAQNPLQVAILCDAEKRMQIIKDSQATVLFSNTAWSQNWLLVILFWVAITSATILWIEPPSEINPQEQALLANLMEASQMLEQAHESNLARQIQKKIQEWPKCSDPIYQDRILHAMILQIQEKMQQQQRKIMSIDLPNPVHTAPNKLASKSPAPNSMDQIASTIKTMQNYQKAAQILEQARRAIAQGKTPTQAKGMSTQEKIPLWNSQARRANAQDQGPSPAKINSLMMPKPKDTSQSTVSFQSQSLNATWQNAWWPSEYDPLVKQYFQTMHFDSTSK